MPVVNMSEKGQVVIPKEIRDRQGLGNGSSFLVIELKSGALVLRPVQPPKRDLVDHLLALRGTAIEIPERKHLAPPRP